MGDVPPVLDAAALVGLLADDDRRRAVAALELGASTLIDVERATGLTTARAARALGRLVDAGLVVDTGDGLHLLGAAFQHAARAARQGDHVSEHADAPADVRRVLDAFVRDGRLAQIPAAHGKRLVVLDWLAQQFEPGRRYPEPVVNEILARRHPDTAALRRYLVDDGFLTREAGVYWRSGGTVAP